ncbi:hypothetical protein [Flammeovirga sp. SJP92]|uniref:hypothetical protein n=1 Tax=Flammeovirga sp. SJP92 TaxID=1775430 RepID=UPI00079C5A33|nr:hypothetical protein [Flammeovirga sp. SJP92]KXX66678.1 hypothetical protein AVL50_31035 [Flammeovirga sp. SJP92]
MKQILFTAITCIFFSLQTNAQYKLGGKFSAMYEDNVRIFTLHKNNIRYGYAIWMNRGSSGNRVKAKYFASGNAYQKYSNWLSGKNIILVSSGAYSNGFASYNTPIGVCVDNGIIVNKKIENKMDGLVIVEHIGGIRVSNISDNKLYLGSLNKSINPKYEMNTLLNWAKSESATVFQTHLLIHSNQLKINYNSSKNVATRRILVLGIDSKGKVMHIVFHIVKDQTLMQVTKDIKSTLSARNIRVAGALNLDTGGCDILEVYDDHNNHIPTVTGTVDQKKATNLLVYYYE